MTENFGKLFVLHNFAIYRPYVVRLFSMFYVFQLCIPNFCIVFRRDVNSTNGSEAFFTPAAFEKYSVTLDFEQKLLRQKHLLCETTQILANECFPASQSKDLNSKQKEIIPNVASGSTSDNDKTLKPSKQSGKQDKFYQPKYWNIKFPRISTLTQTEQSQYAQYFQKYSVTVPSQPTPAEAKEIQLLRELHVKVSAEQNEFLLWLANVSAPQSVEDYEYISPKAQRCIEVCKLLLVLVG